MTINTKYARLLSATKHYIFLLPLASLFLLVSCSSGGSNPPASAAPSNLSIANSSAFEGAGAIEFVVTLNHTSNSVTSFDYRTIPSSASASSDYTSVTKKTASIAAGNSATIINIAIRDDKEVEDAESFIVEILQPSSNTVLDKATGTIEIDDLPSLAITGSSASEDAESIKFTASLSEAFPGNIVSFEYQTIPKSASATIDYTSVARTTSISAGNTTAEIFIDIINDASIEGDEVFEVKISNPIRATISKELAIGVIKGELPSLFIADAAALESDSSIKFVVSLSRAISETLSFSYQTRPISASANLDYISSTKTASIKASDTTAEIFIHITNDKFIESDETFLVSINIINTNPLNVQISRDKAIGTIKIDDLPRLSIADTIALEDAGSIKFLVSLSEAFPDNIVSFNYRIIAGSASADLDYRHYPRTISINAGDTTTELSVAIINDTLIENDETFDLVIINPVNATINENRARATATIKIDELPILAIADATTLEDAGSIKFLVSLSAPFPGNIVSFDYRTIPSSASAGSDYTSVSDTTSIQAGDTTAEILIGIINDASAEGDEVFELKLSNPVNATISKGFAIGIIKGELVSLFVADATALESAKNIKFVVSLSQPQTETVSFDYRTIAGSASATSDYTSVSSTTTIDIGETRAEIFIELINDASVEDDEIFYLAISTNRLDIPITRGVATATIKIDDLPSLSIADTTTLEDAGRIKFTVSLSEAFPGNIVSFDYQTIAGSASANLDYTPFSRSVSINAGDTTAEIFIELINDNLAEDDEIFYLAISNIIKATANITQSTATIKINDLSLFITDATAFENAGHIKFTVSLSEPFPSDKIVPLNYRTIEIAGSASATIDYISASSTAAIQSGDTTTEIFIELINDASVEDDESFYLEISTSQLDIPITRARAIGTIKIEDLPSLSIADTTAFENDASIKFTVSLSEAFEGNIVSFDYRTIPSSASADLDYTSVVDTTSIQAGDTTAEIFIAIINDTLVEDDETFYLVITNPVNASIDIARATATIKIDDLPSLSITDASAVESAGSIKFRVSLSEAFEGNDVSFDYHTTTGSANATLDYTSVSSRATIQAGETRTEIFINIINDASVEDDETFELTISNPYNATIDENAASAIGTIKIDDLPRLSIADAAASEDAGSIKFLVSLSEAFEGNLVAFNYHTTTGSANTQDYTSASSRATIDIGETTTEIVIDLSNDSLPEDAETFMVVISNPYNATIDENRARATGTIKISDLSLSIADSSVKENAGSIKFTVSLSTPFPSNKAVAFNYHTRDTGSAIADSDYTSISSIATIVAGETSTEIMIDISNDSLVEDNETFLVIISTNQLDIPISRATATGTIKIDDLPSLFIADSSASEDDGSISFLVSLSELFPGNLVSFDYQTIETTSANSASSGDDYTSKASRATIDIGELTTSIFIDLSNDTLVEDEETFLVVISSPHNATIAANRARATGNIEIDDIPSLSIADATASESAGSIKFTVSLSATFPNHIVSFDYHTIPSSAMADIDYTSVARTTSINTGDTTAEIFIAILADATIEIDEVFELMISNPVNATIGKGLARGVITGEIPSLSIKGDSVDESARSIKFVVSLSRVIANDVSFDYQTIAISASADLDYTSMNARATISSGSTTTEIIIDISDDTLAEDEESFYLEISNPSSNAAIAISRATATIKINDLDLSIADSSVKENAGRIKFLVSLSEPFPSRKAVAFNYHTRDTGSAIAGTDYTSVVAGRATIDIKDTTTEIVIDLSDDSLIEGDETFLVVISTNQLAIPITRKTATGTIKIDDLPSLAITGSSASEDAGTLTFSARLSEPFYGNLVSFDYQTKRGSANNKATLWQEVLANTATQSPNRWSQRGSIASVVFQNKIWILGGIDGSGFRLLNEVWSSPDGIHWVEATATVDWNERQTHQSVVFDGKMWVLGGSAYGGLQNDVWYSADGEHWSEVTTSKIWNARQLHTSVVFDGKMWVLGGNDGSKKNDVWDSTNGIDWRKVKENNDKDWSARQGHSSVVFDDKIWVMGGKDDKDKDKNDVWYSADGENWSEVTTNKLWSARVGHSSAVFDNKIWVMGGGDNDDKNDVWYSNNGADWNELTTSSSWSPRNSHVSVVFDNKIWVLSSEFTLNDIHFAYATGDYLSASSTRTILGGERSTSIDIELANDDILELTDETFDIIISNLINATIDAISGDNKATSTILADTASWAEATADAGWEARSEHSSVVFDAQMWVLGGSDGSNKNDVWYSIDSINWTRATTTAAWSARNSHSSVVFDDKIWVLGGWDNNYKNDVWYSADGINWLETSTVATWSARYSHTSVVFDDKIWVLGGYEGSNKKDVWYSSNGRDWSEASADAAWSARRGHTSVVFDDKIWVLGGYDDDDTNDVWYSSNGADWSEVTTSSIWDARSSHSSVVFDNKMWVLGGSDNQGDKKDVWYSSNGRNWSEVTTRSIWDARDAHTSVVFKDKIWLLGGKNNQTNKNDVWYLSEQ